MNDSNKDWKSILSKKEYHVLEKKEQNLYLTENITLTLKMVFINVRVVEKIYFIQLQNKNHEGNKKPLFFCGIGVN